MSDWLPAPATGGGLRRLDREAAIAVGEVQRKAAVTMAKIRVIEATTTDANLAAARVKMTEEQLIKLAPLGEAHYQHIADCGITAMAAVMLRDSARL